MSLPNRELHFGVVGVGYWGPNYARILQELPHVKLTWCCDMDTKALDKMKSLYPDISITTQFEELLHDDQLDCIIVVTPAQTHYELVKKALQKGKDVLVEKPLTIKVDQAKKLVGIARKLKRILAIDHTFKFNPGIQKLRELIDTKELGDIYYMYGLYNALGPIRKDVSAMWDISPHFIYIANLLLRSTPRAVSAIGRSFLLPGMEDVVFCNLEYKNNVLVNIHSSWLDPKKVRELIVVGSKKMVKFDDLANEGKIKIYDTSARVDKDPNFANLSVILRTGDVLIPKLDEKEPLKEVLSDFIKAVLTRGEPSTPGEEGYEIVKILNALQSSLITNNKRVSLT